jgi:uncharacterized protein
MKVLFDIGHPAHVHLFKNFISYLNNTGNTTFITTRQKEITNILLDHYKIPYECISKPKGNDMYSMVSELAARDLKLFSLHRKHKFDVSFGTSPSIAQLTLMTLGGVPSYNFSEDDDEVVPLHTYITYPFTTKIVVPDCLHYTGWKNKRLKVNSYHELAYLHPEVFTPDEKVLAKYGLTKGGYVIFRLSALTAHHDSNAKGISGELYGRIKELLTGYEIIESSEVKGNNKIEPWDMHHVMAFAKALISDSQTMTIEAAVLGVPSVRVNTFVGRSTVIGELEEKYKLSYGLLPDKTEDILNAVKVVMSTADNVWKEKAATLLKDKQNLNGWMIRYFESEILKK